MFMIVTDMRKNENYTFYVWKHMHLNMNFPRITEMKTNFIKGPYVLWIL